MKKRIKYVMLIGILGFVFLSCKKEKQPVSYLGYDYFPNKVGHYVIYQCDSIIYDQYNPNPPHFDTFQYQIKEVIDSIYNNEGQITQRIVRYKRYDTSSLNWSSIFTPEKVWTGSLQSTMAIRQEDNNVYIKLIFPMSLNTAWNGNAMNTLQFPGNYTCTAYNTPATVGGVYFDSTITVLQVNNPSNVGNQYYVEQYAAGVGLIFKEVIDYQGSFAFTIPAPPDSAKSGTIYYTETYVSSGNQ
jgi:hypothetical protein